MARRVRQDCSRTTSAEVPFPLRRRLYSARPGHDTSHAAAARGHREARKSLGRPRGPRGARRGTACAGMPCTYSRTQQQTDRLAGARPAAFGRVLFERGQTLAGLRREPGRHHFGKPRSRGKDG